MISVAEAVARICAAVDPVATEIVALPQALGRVLAADVPARLTHPPAAVSAMDGYAVRAADVGDPPAVLTVIGAVPAGQVFAGTVGAGEAVRIFTGAPVPDGADAIVIQENTQVEGNGRVRVLERAAPGRFVRPAGLDFGTGMVGLTAGRRLSARDLTLAAAMNVPWLTVRRRPRVAVLSSGDELVMPGDPVAPGQIVGCNGIGVSAFVDSAGGSASHLGIAADTRAALAACLADVGTADVLVTTGGASEGEHDLVQGVLTDLGMTAAFWKIAMRPGKPLFFGRLGHTRVLGFPGNPVSAMVCSAVFLHPLLRALQGLPDDTTTLETTARLTAAMPANDRRQEYARATLARDADGQLTVTPASKQDSSMVSRLAWADCFVVRPPHAPPEPAGADVPIRHFPTPLY